MYEHAVSPQEFVDLEVLTTISMVGSWINPYFNTARIPMLNV